ncbi:MAG: hypothetical protein JXA81_13360 [Sedimentisphaerales bacterium]|nr:hypothetical protein [Sedimentisphaerales bacterium]
MAVHALEPGANVHVGARAGVEAALLPARLGVAGQADLIARLADDIRRNSAVGVELRLVLGDHYRLALVHRPADGRETRACGCGPAEVHRAELFVSLGHPVAGQVTQQTIGLDDPALGPPGLVVIAIEVVLAARGKAAGGVGHPAVVPLALTVIFC